MARIAKSLTELVGNTPLLEFSNFNASKNLRARVVGKLEYFNPAGSVKDRIALAMIEDADRKSTRLNSSHTDSSRMPSSA